MSLQLNRVNIWVILVSLMAVSFPWSERLNSVFVILLTVHWLFDKNLFEKIKSVKRKWAVVIPFWVFFALHFLFLIGSNYPSEAMHTIEVKLTVFLFPLLFATENYLTHKRQNNLLWMFCLSCFASTLYGLAYYYFNYYQTHQWIYYFNRMFFSIGIMHPGYYSNYFLVALFFLSRQLLHQKLPSRFHRGVAVFLILEFLFSLFILVSKTAIIILFLYTVYFIWELLSRIGNSIVKILFFSGAAIFALLLFTQVPSIKNRIYETKENVSTMDHNTLYRNSTGSRIVAWTLEWELIQANWLKGYGTGSANSVFFNKLVEEDYKDLQLHKMHTHNQFFHTWIDLGLAGILSLLTVFLMVFKRFYTQGHMLGFWTSFVLFMNCFTDDALEIQAIIVFSLFFICLLLYRETDPYAPSPPAKIL